MSIRLLSSDIDGTVLGKPDATLDFRENWQRLDKAKRPILCYNTGRELEDTQNCVRTTSLPEPDFLICGVGTVIYDWKNHKPLKGFTEILEEGWNHDKVNQLMETVTGIQKQPPQHQNEFKSSWWLEDASQKQLKEIEQMLADADLEVHVVYSSERDLDVLPKHANKGNALKWLLKHLKIDPEDTIVAGDTGNDITMFQLSGVKGILPVNAKPELLERTVGKNVYKAPGHCADGVLDGLKFFGVLKEIVRSENQDKGHSQK